MKNEVIELKERVKGSKYVRKAKVARDLFIEAAGKGLADPTTIETAATMGLWNGFKYKGNLKRGIGATATTFMVIAGVHGTINVAVNWDKVKNG